MMPLSVTGVGGVLSNSPVYLTFLDSSPFVSGQMSPNANAAEVWEFTEAQLVDGYTGGPAKITRLPHPLYAGRGHGLCLHSSGYKIVVTSDSPAGNQNESAILIPPGAEWILEEADCRRYTCGRLFAGTSSEATGLRDVFELSDGTVLIGSTAGDQRFVRCTIEQMLNDEMDGLPTYQLSISPRLNSYDAVRIPNTDQLWFNGDDQIALFDFSGPPGVLTPLKVARGNQIGVPGPDDWYGFLVLGPDLSLFKQYGSLSQIVRWLPETLAAMTSTPANTPHDDVLTSPAWSALPSNESMISCLDFDKYGNLWVASNTSNRYRTLNLVQSAHSWGFSTAKVNAGSSQTPDMTITLPNWTQPWLMRISPQFRLYSR